MAVIVLLNRIKAISLRYPFSQQALPFDLQASNYFARHRIPHG